MPYAILLWSKLRMVYKTSNFHTAYMVKQYHLRQSRQTIVQFRLDSNTLIFEYDSIEKQSACLVELCLIKFLSDQFDCQISHTFFEK
jgi:hypothetical protein